MPDYRWTVDHVTIPLSASVSGAFSLKHASALGLWAPAVTSCAAYLQVSFETASASFLRAAAADGAGDWTWALGPGSKAAAVGAVAGAFPYARVETGVPQAEVRSFAVVTKR